LLWWNYGKFCANILPCAVYTRIQAAIDKDTLDSKYITQTLLPNFETEHPELTQGWDVTYDARGNLIEPHTGVQVGLDTLGVRDYLEERPALGPAIALVDRASCFTPLYTICW
jgi:hypothetical protein